MGPLEISKKLRPLRNQTGQATLEYVLIVCIVVAIVSSLATQFFKPLGDFINSYMGNYVGCLLESGELPALGSDTEAGPSDPGCDAKFEPATLAAGRPAKSTSDSSSSSPLADSKNASSKSGSGSSGGSSSNSGYAGSAGGSDGLNGRAKRGRNTDSAAGQPKVVEISIGTTEAGGFYKHAHGGSSVVSSLAPTKNQVYIYGLTGPAQKEAEAEKKGVERTVAGEIVSRNQKKFTLPPPPAPPPKIEEQESSFGIGGIFRFILIAGILIILIAMVGGQVTKLMKGWEK